MANFIARKNYKQMYPATYNFRDDAVGDEPAGWVSNNGAGCTTTIASELGGHKKLIKLVDAGVGQCEIVQTFTAGAQISGTVEFHMVTDDITKPTFFQILSGVTRGPYVAIRNSKFEWYDGVFNDSGKVPTNNVISHHKIIFDCATDTYDWYIDEVLAVADIPFENVATDLDNIALKTTGVIQGQTSHFDAVGYSWDPDYKIGDNIFWRSYVMTDDDFNNDDITETGTSIIWVDFATTAAATTLEHEFNEHKKVLKQVESAGNDICYHTIGAQSRSRTYEWWLKFGDKTQDSRWFLDEDASAIVLLRVEGGVFQYEDQSGPTWQTISGVTVTNNTWYHIRVLVTDAATDTFDIWIDNVLRVTGGECRNNQTSGINRMYLQAVEANSVVYLDAFAVVRTAPYRDADNRTFKYNVLSYEDIASSISFAEVSDEAYLTSTAIIKIPKDLITLSGLHILQLFDVNSDLRFEGNYFKKTTNAGIDIFTFHSLNKSNLKKPSTYTASSLDPSQILLNIFTDIGQAASNDARLQYYEEDDPAGSHSPTIINTPNREIIRRMAYHADRYAIIQPNGVFTLDADCVPSNGAYTISSSTGEIRGDPLIESFDSQINKVIVYGAFDPDRGIFFNGSSTDSTAQDDGTGVLEYSKWYPDLRSDADCTNRAVAIRTGTGFNPKIITVTFLNVYATPGEIINFAYSPKSFSAQNVYVKKVTHNLGSGISHYELSTGIFEDWGLSQEQWSLATEGERQINEGIFATDINTVDLNILATTGTQSSSGLQITNGEYFLVSFYLDDFVDPTRDIEITVSYYIAAAAGGTFDFLEFLWFSKTDGSEAFNANQESNTPTFPATTLGRVYKYTYTMAASKFDAGDSIVIQWILNEASKEIRVRNITLRYYIKRVI